ncbi:MAG: hypothetical protein CMH78_03895 [Nitrospinae bacterium]|jgi:hypothetical protein|nr:hypothetical protein [Nitrospinota bacterium]|tara:strand:+ start:618 stop:1064 length:447 start_codon:yes stop_codon:yes gene_type:complete
MGDWLGTGKIANKFKKFRTFRQAQKYVRSLRLKSTIEWKLYLKGEMKGKPKRPHDIPSMPSRVYKEDWKGMGDWLGTGRIATHLRTYRSFKEAKKFAKSLGLKSGKEWNQYKKGELKGKPKKPDDIPAYPSHTYKNKGWQGMADWLGK